MLRDYQEKLINQLSALFGKGFKRIVLQLPTGGGKTVIFSAIVDRYLRRNTNNHILICVHREELLEQARRTIYTRHGIICQPVTPEVKTLPHAQVYIAMIETADRRLKKNPNYFRSPGLIIYDECHVGNHKKTYQHFPDSLIVGVTATPIAATKKDPLKNHYQTIVCGPQIEELISSGSLARNVTYNVKGIRRNIFKMKGGDFDSHQMGITYSTPKHVENCVDAYERFCMGLKTIVFNCNVEHSKLVNDCFLLNGYNSKHLDGESQDRKQILEWYKHTPNAILNNIGVLTQGFDEPSIMRGIINKSTASLPLWLQMPGRCSRPFYGKDQFFIIDMGGNALDHGDWCADRNWQYMFENPEEPSKGGGVAPVKDCPACEAIIPASSSICPICGETGLIQPNYDAYRHLEFEQIVKGKPISIDVPALIANGGQKPYIALHQIKNKIIATARHQWIRGEMTDEVAYKLLAMYQEKVQEWCKLRAVDYNQWHKDIPAQWFFKALETTFKWKPQIMEL